MVVVMAVTAVVETILVRKQVVVVAQADIPATAATAATVLPLVLAVVVQVVVPVAVEEAARQILPDQVAA
jgi:hypothetical protein